MKQIFCFPVFLKLLLLDAKLCEDFMEGLLFFQVKTAERIHINSQDTFYPLRRIATLHTNETTGMS